MKKNNIYRVLSIVFLLASCQKFVDIPISPQLIASTDLFESDNTAISAVDGVYASIRSGTPSFANGSIGIYTGLSADEIVNTSSSTTYDPFFMDQLISNNSTVTATFWTAPYNIIYRANAIIEGLNKSTGVSTSVKSQLIGEMEVTRALTYFYLVNLLGDVPLVVSTDYTQSSVAPRAPSSAIYAQMIADLKNAQSLLTNTYPSTGKARPNKQTATALLARVYLYQKDWINSEAMASQVISSGLYALQPVLNDVFLINSTETIWEIASPSESRITGEASTFIPSSTTVKPPFAISSYLLNAFEAGDQRKVNWLKANTVAGIVYYYPYKFKNRVITAITEYNVVLRLSEQYLIRAEARAQQSQTKVPDAIADLNIIRSRAGLSPLPALQTQAQCLASVSQERRVELFTEWGNRWLDLKRSGTVDAVLAPEKVGWQSYQALYPIPYSQILANINLTQNPGYPN